MNLLEHLNIEGKKLLSKGSLRTLKGGALIACCVYLPDGTFAYSGNSTTGSCDGAGICTGCYVLPCDESEFLPE